MKLSIVILTRNEENRIEKCIASIIGQNKFENCEIIIVDGQSSDSTVERIQKLIKVHSCINVVICDKYGYSYQRNVGVSHAKGDYIIFISGDTILAPNSLARCFQLMKNYEIIQGTIINKAIDTRFSKIMVDIHPLLYRAFYKNNPVEIFSTILVCIKRKLLLEIPFDENTVSMEDKEWMYKIFEKFPSLRFCHANGLVLYHLFHESFPQYYKKVNREAIKLGMLCNQYCKKNCNYFNWFGITVWLSSCIIFYLMLLFLVVALDKLYLVFIFFISAILTCTLVFERKQLFAKSAKDKIVYSIVLVAMYTSVAGGVLKGYFFTKKGVVKLK